MHNTVFDRICEWWFDLNGWKIIGDLPYHYKQLVIIAAPHTSGWDFIYGIGARRKTKMHVNFIGKKELFDSPFTRYIFTSMGGSPVDRSGNKNKVDEVLKHFKTNKRYVLALAPEGTRKKVDKFRSGFYYIAKKGKLPVVMVALDFGRKEIVFRPAYHLKGENAEQEILSIQNWFNPFKAAHPEKWIN